MADLKYITTTFLLPQKQYLRMLSIYMHSDQKQKASRLHGSRRLRDPRESGYG